MTGEHTDPRNMVSVYGHGIGSAMLKSNDVRLIQIRDGDGELMAMMFRLNGSMWAFTTRGDSDWESHKRRLEIDDTKE